MSARPVPIHMFSFQERNSGRLMYKAFARMANVEIIQVIPVERAAPAGYTLWYTPHLQPLALGDSLDNNQQKFAEYFEVVAAIRILQKAKRDTRELEATRDLIEKRVRSAVNNRDSEAEQAGTSSDGHYTDGWPPGSRRFA